MKRAGNAPSAPIVPGGSPDWFQAYGRTNTAVIQSLLREIEALKARLTAAGIV